MQRIVTVVTCDVCKRKVENAENITYPVIFHTHQSDGAASAPYISQKKLDVCEDCMKRVLVLHGWGAQGSNEYQILDGGKP